MTKLSPVENRLVEIMARLLGRSKQSILDEAVQVMYKTYGSILAGKGYDKKFDEVIAELNGESG